MIDLIKEYIKFRESHFIVEERDNIDNLLKSHNIIDLQTTYRDSVLQNVYKALLYYNSIAYKADVDASYEYANDLKRWQNSIDSTNSISLLRKKYKNNGTNNSISR